jgi:hypothetical protein
MYSQFGKGAIPPGYEVNGPDPRMMQDPRMRPPVGPQGPPQMPPQLMAQANPMMMQQMRPQRQMDPRIEEMIRLNMMGR